MLGETDGFQGKINLEQGIGNRVMQIKQLYKWKKFSN